MILGCSLYRDVLYIGVHCIGISLYYGSYANTKQSRLVKREKRADFIFLLPFSSGIFGAALGFCHVFLLKTEFSSSMGIIHSLNKVIKYSFIVLNIHTLCFCEILKADWLIKVLHSASA